ncbi:MAG: hypothetical protein ACHP9T_12115 [Caulobacterales bacterium]
MWSKKASMAWAQGTLDPAWRDLIARAEAVRKGDTAQSGQTADAPPLGGARPAASKFTPSPTGPAAGAGVVRATSAS